MTFRSPWEAEKLSSRELETKSEEQVPVYLI
jgi:hypothetical protein